MDKNLTVKQLKDIINNLPDNMPIVIPVIDTDHSDIIHGFRFVRTIGVLKDEHENPDTVLCINTATDNQNISDQIRMSYKDELEVLDVLK